jgi:transposase
LDLGYSIKEVADILLIDQDTVTKIKKKYDKGQFSDWLADAYKGYAGKLTKEQEGDIDRHVQESLITDCRQLIVYIQKKYGIPYSISGVTKLLTRLNFSYKLTVLIPGKLDPKAQKAWLKKYTRIKKNLKEDEVILFHDGVHPTHNPHKTKAWIKKGQDKQIKTNTGRARLNINGALDIENMKVVTHFSETINADEVIKHYDKIQKAYPDKKKIYLVEDNARYYKNAKVEAYLKDPTCRIVRIFLPAYSPNLNFIERLWKFMKKYIIGVTYREKFKQFEDAIHQFFDNFDQYEERLRKFIGTELHLVQVTI